MVALPLTVQLAKWIGTSKAPFFMRGREPKSVTIVFFFERWNDQRFTLPRRCQAQADI